MNHKRNLAIITVIVSALLFLYTLISYANKTYPMVGHDFSYFVPHLLDTFIHYRVNNLSIQWYTPSFGGGLPAYPNPQHMQFTLPALLMTLAGPWNAIWISNAIFITIGFISTYYLFEHGFELDPLSSAIGTIIFNINGFVFSHAIVGHLGYQAFPLLPLSLLILFHKNVKTFYKGLALAIILSINIYSGGFYVIVIYLLSSIVTIPILIILQPQLFLWKSFTQTVFFTILFTLTISGSKLHAVLSFMQWFPRETADHYDVSIINGLYGVFFQLFGSTLLLTVIKIVGNINIDYYLGSTQNLYGASYGLWEFDTGISITSLILCVLLPTFYFRTKKGKEKKDKRFILLLALALLGLWLTTEFRLTKGLIYPILRDFPIIKSLHVNLRFSAAYLLPIAVLSAISFKYLQKKINHDLYISSVFLFFSILTLTSLLTYKSFPTNMYGFGFDISEVESIYQNMKKQESFHIKSIENISETDAFHQEASSLVPYEPIFGYTLDYFQPLITEGPVDKITNNYFNITNPASLVFPEENNLSLFERISVNEPYEFILFTSYKQPDWERPLIQDILDIFMLVSIVLIIIVILVNLGMKLRYLTGKQN